MSPRCQLHFDSILCSLYSCSFAFIRGRFFYTFSISKGVKKVRKRTGKGETDCLTVGETGLALVAQAVSPNAT
jgi:hypothetical protein